MTDVEADEGGVVHEVDIAQLAPALTRKVLQQVAQERRRQDEIHGMLRDFRDGTAGTRFHGPAATTDKQAVLEAKRAMVQAKMAGRQSWRHHLELECCQLFSESNEAALRAQLVVVAATVVAWAEGIDTRADEKRIALEQRAMSVRGGKLVPFGTVKPWWRRLLAWLMA